MNVSAFGGTGRLKISAKCLFLITTYLSMWASSMCFIHKGMGYINDRGCLFKTIDAYILPYLCISMHCPSSNCFLSFRDFGVVGASSFFVEKAVFWSGSQIRIERCLIELDFFEG